MELKPIRGIHSEIHALAKDISEYCGEPKKFALYLGVIKRIGKNKAYQIFSELKQSKDVDSKAKLFMYMSSKKYESRYPKRKRQSNIKKKIS